MIACYIKFHFIDHLQSGMVYNFCCVCLSVCLPVCHMITFESLDMGAQKSLFPQYTTFISHNSSSVKHRARRFAYSMGFLAMAHLLVWPPSLSRDRKWPRVSKCMHSRVVGLRLEGILVIIIIIIMAVVVVVVVVMKSDATVTWNNKKSSQWITGVLVPV